MRKSTDLIAVIGIALGGVLGMAGSTVANQDVRAVCPDVLRHRIGLTYEAEAENITVKEIIDRVLNTVEVP